VTVFARWRAVPSAIALRPALFALAALFAATSAVFVAVTWSYTWGADGGRNIDAARALVDGRFGSIDLYLYSPLAAAVTTPALLVPRDVALAFWVVAHVALLAIGTLIVSRGLPSVDRLLAVVAMVAFLPAVHDLVLGNITIAVAVAIACVAWRRDGWLTGIPLGVLLATAPKPALAVILIWMLVHRRRSLTGAIVTAVGATLAAVVVLGPDVYRAWIATLLDPPILAGGNFGLSGLPPPIAVLVSVVVVVATVVAIRRGPMPGLVAAIACGLLVSPYTVLYAATAVLVVVPALAVAAPFATLVLAFLAPVGLIALFPVWIGSLIGLAILIPAERWPGSVWGFEGGRRPEERSDTGAGDPGLAAADDPSPAAV
jgi:hypothetical protein